MEVIVRYLLAGLLLVLGAAKLLWPASDSPLPAVLYLSIAIFEVVLGLGLLFRRFVYASILMAPVFFFSLVGYGAGSILRSGIGVLEQPCGCLGNKVDPTRGAMLAVAALGLVAAGWLARSWRSRRSSSESTDMVAGAVGPLALVAALGLALAGVGTSHSSEIPVLDTTRIHETPTTPPPRLRGSPPRTTTAREQVQPDPAESIRIARSLGVRVVTMEGRAPIAGAAVWIPGTREVTKTSDDGVARLDVDTDSACEVLARTIDGIWARAQRKEGASLVTLPVPEETRLSGTVRWLDGSPAAGLRLRILGSGSERPPTASPTPSWDARRTDREAQAGSGGEFQVRGLTEPVVVVQSAEEAASILGPGVPTGAADSVTARLPSLDLQLVAARGRWVDVNFVDAETGDPVGARLVVRLNFGEDYAAFRSAVTHDRRISQVRFLWPSSRDGFAQVRCTASAPGYQDFHATLDKPTPGGPAVLRMLRRETANGRLRVRNPWPKLESAWDPSFRLHCNGELVGGERHDPGVLASVAGDAWVFQGVPPGECTVTCNGLLFASASVRPGETVTVEPILDEMSHLVLRPVFKGQSLRGKVRVITRGWGIGLQVSELTVSDRGELHVIPALKGRANITISQGQLVSEPRVVSIEIPGGGETVVANIEMRAR